jgi:hypothetical protein
MSRQFIDDREFDLVAAHLFNARKAHMLAVAEFVKLAYLSAQDAPEVMRRFSRHNGAASCKLVDKKSPAHAQILSHPILSARHFERSRPIFSSFSLLRKVGLRRETSAPSRALSDEISLLFMGIGNGNREFGDGMDFARLPRASRGHSFTHFVAPASRRLFLGVLRLAYPERSRRFVSLFYFPTL